MSPEKQLAELLADLDHEQRRWTYLAAHGDRSAEHFVRALQVIRDAAESRTL